MDAIEQVRRLVHAGGLTPAGALKAAIEQRDQTIAGIAATAEIGREDLSAVVNLRLVPNDAQLAALSNALGCEPRQWRALWWELAIPDDIEHHAKTY